MLVTCTLTYQTRLWTEAQCTSLVVALIHQVRLKAGTHYLCSPGDVFDIREHRSWTLAPVHTTRVQLFMAREWSRVSKTSAMNTVVCTDIAQQCFFPIRPVNMGCVQTPVHTTRVHGPWTRVSKMAPVFTGRVYGARFLHPWTWASVCTTNVHGTWTRVSFLTRAAKTGSVYRA